MINCKTASISRIQKALWSWQNENFPQYGEGFGCDLIEHLKYGVIEEVGELFHAILKDAQCIRGTHEEHLADMKDAIGDALVYAAQLHSACNEELKLNTAGFSNSTLIYHASAAIAGLDDDDLEAVVLNIEWLAGGLELNAEECFRLAAEQVLARDWLTYPETGKPANLDAAGGEE